MATFTWTKTGIKGTWETSGNWSPTTGFPATITDVAVFGDLLNGSNPASYTVTLAAGGSPITISEMDVTTNNSAALINISGSLTTNTLSYKGNKATALTVLGGGVFDILNPITTPAVPEVITVSAKGVGGLLQLGSLSVGAVSNLTFNFQNSSGSGINIGAIEIQGKFTPGETATQRITGVGTGDAFIIDNANFAGDTVTYSGTTLNVVSGTTGIVFTMNNVNPSNNPPTGFAIVGPNIILAVCYARGTMIRTPDGELPVEKLRRGRQVITLVDGQEVPQAVTWLGHRRIALANHPRPEAVAPIRIRRDAFADGTPRRDLWSRPTTPSLWTAG